MTTIFRPSIIDVESSGLGWQSYPIEVGIALASGERYSTLILPAKGWDHWDRNAEKIHRLSRDIITKHGKTIFDVALKLNELLGPTTIYTDGWVVDHPWIAKLYDTAGIRKTFWLSPLETILSEDQMAIWHDTRQKIEQKNQLRRHRASTDAMIVQETYVETQRLAAEPLS